MARGATSSEAKHSLSLLLSSSLPPPPRATRMRILGEAGAVRPIRERPPAFRERLEHA